jgi:L-fuculose-phosphate aldolase
MPNRKKIVEICHRIYNNGYVSAYEGNVSERINKNYFLITRSGICKGDVTEKDVLLVDTNGKVLEGKGKISTESRVHLYIYKKRKDINSVVHCHPVYTSILSILGKGLTRHIFPEVVLSLGKVPLCKYETPSTAKLAKSLEPYVNYSHAFILQNHGAATIGQTIEDAYFKMEKLEHTAEIIYKANLAGKIRALPKKKVEELISISEETYNIKTDRRNIF